MASGSLTPFSVSPQSLDLAEYNVLFVLSFTTPAFDSDVAPSFGTLLATVNVALNMLGEVLAISLFGRAQQLQCSQSAHSTDILISGSISSLYLLSLMPVFFSHLSWIRRRNLSLRQQG